MWTISDGGGVGHQPDVQEKKIGQKRKKRNYFCFWRFGSPKYWPSGGNGGGEGRFMIEQSIL